VLYVYALVRGMSAVAAYFFVYWMSAALLGAAAGLPMWFTMLGANGAAIVAARYAWMYSALADGGLVRSIVVGAVATGGIGFIAGFFGPLLFAPGANQGPLLGIFITGPLGFIAGAIGGAVYWFWHRSDATS
jgi:hypothetical protein